MRLTPHLRGHALLFEAPAAPTYSASAGARLLLIFIVLELVLGPRLALPEAAGLVVPLPELRVPLMLAAALLLARFAAGVPLAQLGLRRWRQWSTVEKSYLVQVVLGAALFLGLVFTERLRAAFGPVFATQLLWGFHQEFMYRGILQTELARRWGAPTGLLAANALFTFGPLHLHHFSLPPPQAVLMFAAIFAVGGFFGLLRARSGNLWLPGVFHGIGNAWAGAAP